MHAALTKHCQSLLELATELAPVMDEVAEFLPKFALVNDNSGGSLAAVWQQVYFSHDQRWSFVGGRTIFKANHVSDQLRQWRHDSCMALLAEAVFSIRLPVE